MTNIAELPVKYNPDVRWAEFVRQGLDVRSRAEDLQWELGELALSVETSYGDQSLAKFADAIGSSYDSLKTYRNVVAKIGRRLPNLSFGVMQAISGSEQREALAARAIVEHWTVRRARAEAKPPKEYGAKAAKPQKRRQMPSRIGFFNAISDAIEKVELLSETTSEEELLAYLPHDDRRALERAVTRAGNFAEKWGDLLTRPIERRYIEESA